MWRGLFAAPRQGQGRGGDRPRHGLPNAVRRRARRGRGQRLPPKSSSVAATLDPRDGAHRRLPRRARRSDQRDVLPSLPPRRGAPAGTLVADRSDRGSDHRRPPRPPAPRSRGTASGTYPSGTASAAAGRRRAEHGFVSAGNGSWYSGTLAQLSPRGPGLGPRAQGRATSAWASSRVRESPLRDHVIDGRPAPEVLQTVPPDTFEEDPDRWKYIVPVRWLQTVPLEQAVHRTGHVRQSEHRRRARRRRAWRTTVEQLKDAFPAWDGEVE